MRNNVLNLGPIKHLVILGSDYFAQNIETLCKNNGVKLYYITSTDQAKTPTRYSKDITLITDSILTPEVSKFLNYDKTKSNEVLAISFGARWILKEKIRQELFCGNVLNAHGTRLPIDRGGGGFSWRIMRGDRLGNLMLHLIDDGLDSGPAVLFEEFVIPADKQTPEEINQDYRDRQKIFLLNFLNDVINSNHNYPLHHQTGAISTYFPRLNTNINGFINWDWEPMDIKNFILAFDSPYQGASTYWNDTKIHIRKAQLHIGEIGFHPFQSGLVVRNNKKWLTVALKGQYSLIIETAENELKNNILPNIKEGDRLYTPAHSLESAKILRVLIGPEGIKNK